MNGESSEQRQPASKPGRLSGSAAFMMAPMAFGAPVRLWQVLALILGFGGRTWPNGAKRRELW